MEGLSVVIASEDRFLGCLLGLAIGDAVGTTLEFETPGAFQPISDMVGGGPFRLNPGEWTDDTSMALCLATSLREKQDFDARDQMERYSRWSSQGYLSSNGVCFDIGNTVSAALDRFQIGGQPYSGTTDPSSAGNGSIMRLAPVPMFYGNDAIRAIEFSAQSSKTTHGARSCVDACRYLGALIWGALNGIAKDDLLAAYYAPTGVHWDTELLCSEIAEIASGSFKEKQPPEIRGTGYVVRSLEAALWAFFRSDDFRTGCLLAVNLGDDADTTGAVYGQLAGAYYGRKGIPEAWLNRLAKGLFIEELAGSLYHASQNGNAVTN
ncbi:ADP-ribosylglycohydrolase family protein [soil metagenome]